MDRERRNRRHAYLNFNQLDPVQVYRNARRAYTLASNTRKLYKLVNQATAGSTSGANPVTFTAGTMRRGQKRRMSQVGGRSKRRKYRRNSRYKTSGKIKSLKGRKRVKRGKRKPSLKKRVSKLERKTNDMTSSLTYKRTKVGSVSCTPSQATYQNVDGNKTSFVETILGNVKYWDSGSSPAGFVEKNVNASTGDGYDKLHFKSCYSVLHVKNSYQYPVEVRIYAVRPKSDTNTPPTTEFSNSVAEETNVGDASPYIYPTEIKEFQRAYDIITVRKKILQSGAVFKDTCSTKNFYYNPQFQAGVTEQHQPRLGAYTFMIRVAGVISHDDTADPGRLYGTGPGRVDYHIKTVWQMKYNSGGPKVCYTRVEDNQSITPASNAFTGIYNEAQNADGLQPLA